MQELKKVAILINGGDAPGLNAVIRAIIKSAKENNVECYGFIEGYKGLLENNYIRLDGNPISSGIYQRNLMKQLRWTAAGIQGYSSQ